MVFNSSLQRAIEDSLIVSSPNTLAKAGIKLAGHFSEAELSLPSFKVGATPATIRSFVEVAAADNGASSIRTVSVDGSKRADLRLEAAGRGEIQLGSSGTPAVIVSGPTANVAADTAIALSSSGIGSPMIAVVALTSRLDADLTIAPLGNGSVKIGGLLKLPIYSFEALPTGDILGAIAFCSDCRKPGEEKNDGTGIPVVGDRRSVWSSLLGAPVGR